MRRIIRNDRDLTPRRSVRCLNTYVDLFRSTAFDTVASVNTSTITSAVTAGATVLPWANTAGLAVGELIFVNPDSDNFDTAVITGIAGLNVTVSPPLTNAHPSGTQVGQLWVNATHIYGNGGDVFGRFLAKAITEEPTGPVVVLGDSWSIITGPEYLAFVASLTARFPDVVVHNAGIAGNRLDQMLARFASDVTPRAPSLVVHMSGFANDLAAARTEVQTKGDIEALILACRAIGADLLMAGVAPMSSYAIAATRWPIYREYANSFTS